MTLKEEIRVVVFVQFYNKNKNLDQITYYEAFCFQMFNKRTSYAIIKHGTIGKKPSTTRSTNSISKDKELNPKLLFQSKK